MSFTHNNIVLLAVFTLWSLSHATSSSLIITILPAPNVLHALSSCRFSICGVSGTGKAAFAFTFSSFNAPQFASLPPRARRRDRGLEFSGPDCA